MTKKDHIPDDKSTPKAISEKTSAILGVKTYVLEDERVVITATHLQEAFGQQRRGNVSTENGGAELPRFLARLDRINMVSAELTAGLKSPLSFSMPGGGLALGYDSDLLTEIALAVITAAVAGVLRHGQQRMASAARKYLAATSKTGARYALLDEHGMQPRSGAAAGVLENLQRELDGERSARLRLEGKLEVQLQAYDRLMVRTSDLETQQRIITSGAIGEVSRIMTWFRKRIEDIAFLRKYGQPMTIAQAKGAVLEELRRVLSFQHAPMDQFPFARLDDLRLHLFWMHRDARKSAKRHGFGGSGAWTQPPLPFTGVDPEDDEDDDDGESGGGQEAA